MKSRALIHRGNKHGVHNSAATIYSGCFHAYATRQDDIAVAEFMANLFHEHVPC